MKQKIFFAILFIFIGFVIGISSGSIESQKENSPQNLLEPPASPTIKELYPTLPFDVSYFNYNDLRSGTATYYKDFPENDIRQFSQAYLNNLAVYQSYPSTKITFKEYENRDDSLDIKSLESTLKSIEDPSWSNQAARTAYEKWGKLITNYLPNYLVEGVEKVDVDGDGVDEIIVQYNFFGRADAGSYQSDIIKNNKIIFTAGADESSIVPADTSNGFYVEWRIPDNSSRCCSTGFMRTRFVWHDSAFTPIYEQEVRYLSVGKDFTE